MSHKLLLADDSASIRRVIELTFADEDVEVVAVGDGEQAIEAIRRETPDIVLVDASLPATDGYGIASFVRNDSPHARIPVVLLTGAFEPLDESRAAAAGCRDVLVKPFAPREVIDKVRELLGPVPAAAAHAADETASADAAPAVASPAEELAAGTTAPGTDSSDGGVAPGAPAAPIESTPAEATPAGTAAEADVPDAPEEPAVTAEPAAHLPTAAAMESTAPLAGAAVLARAFAAFLAAEQAASTPAGRTRDASGAASAPEASATTAGGERGTAPGAS